MAGEWLWVFLGFLFMTMFGGSYSSGGGAGGQGKVATKGDTQ